MTSKQQSNQRRAFQRRNERAQSATLKVGNPVRIYSLNYEQTQRNNNSMVQAITSWWLGMSSEARPVQFTAAQVAREVLNLDLTWKVHREIGKALVSIGFNKRQFSQKPQTCVYSATADLLGVAVDTKKHERRRDDCTYYLKCLNYAVDCGWDDFSCAQCSDYKIADDTEIRCAALGIAATWANARKS